MKFSEGQDIRRLVDGRAVSAGWEYKVVLSDIFSEGTEQLVADGGFIKELLTPDVEKEFTVIEE